MSDPIPWIDALRRSHERLSALVATLDEDDLRSPSYCDDWSVAQVLSHLGSGAQIFQMLLDAVLAGEQPPPPAAFPPIWERWNALSPEDQASELQRSDAQLVTSLGEAGDRLGDLSATLFGTLTVDGAGFVGMRLNEHALHTWDVVVPRDVTARVPPDAVGLLLDRLPTAGFAGRAHGGGRALPRPVTIGATDAGRAFRIDAGQDVHITEVDDVRPDLRLPAEATLRLVYGRLDDAHCPPVLDGERAALGLLRQVFRGF